MAVTAKAFADSPQVVVTIAPIHSLVAGVMEGAGVPRLLFRAEQSPHGAPLRPSFMRRLHEADLTVWVGRQLENSASRGISGAATARYTIMDDDGIKRLSVRPGGLRRHLLGKDAHSHGDHGHYADAESHEDHGHDADAESHEDHGHDADDESHEAHGHDADTESHEDHGHDADAESHEDHGHDADDESHEDHGHDADAESHEGHGHDADAESAWQYDPHIWLSITNAQRIVQQVAMRLSEIDRENASVYASNAARLMERIQALKSELAEQLHGVPSSSYLMFHDAFQYFEDDFSLNGIGSMLSDPQRQPGVRRIEEIRHYLMENEVRCVFTEPQFSHALMYTVAEDLDINIDQLDPLGVGITPGPDLWFSVMRNIAAGIVRCTANTPQ